ncbi:DUF6355 family natural product biosynthesis protein [Allokutzneria sp. NRRL B-24872]|uniref:DUF6355 family natural product biosynthesis protein n=1 Tax=Allokutzneria sp. NRRL B-24872 TaxID=1137961 RepID=UPI000A39F547|nr:DUF6355 family natural product biosynthesis protein [Allokutzneria sp. NRRL B-24872]
MKKRILGLAAAALTIAGTLGGTMVVTSGVASARSCGHTSEGFGPWTTHYYKHCGAGHVWVDITVNHAVQPSTCVAPNEERNLGRNVTKAHSTGVPCGPSAW